MDELGGMFRVRVGSWVIYCVSESPHKDRRARVCVSVCVHRMSNNEKADKSPVSLPPGKQIHN